MELEALKTIIYFCKVFEPTSISGVLFPLPCSEGQTSADPAQFK